MSSSDAGYYLNPKSPPAIHAYRESNLSMDYPTQSQPDFNNFFHSWITRLDLFLHQLLHLLQSPDQNDDSKLQLIRQVLAHYHEYVLAKAHLSRQNVFTVLSPPWLRSYERTFVWLSGFRPGLIINVVKSCGVELSSDQAERLDRLTMETKDEEREITKRLARLEQHVVAPPMLSLARIGGREVNGVDNMVEGLAEELKFLVGCADYLREKTVAKVVEILSTAQTVRFLAAAALLQLKIRRWGQLRDHGRR